MKRVFDPFVISFFGIIFMVLTFSTHVHAQPWLREVKPPEKGILDTGDYLELKQAFHKYWENHPIERGKGYKPFSRWEWMMDARLASSTDRSAILWEEYLHKMGTKNGNMDGTWMQIPLVTPPTDLDGYIVGSGRIDCIEFHPKDPETFYVGSPTGGLWKTTNGGLTWVTLTDQLPSMGIADIAIHPEHPDTIYIATGDRDAGEVYSVGILKSTDGGQTWNTTALNYSQSQKNIFNRLLIRPDQPDTLIAASNFGIYLLSNGGDDFTFIRSGHFKDLEFKPGSPRVIYAASYSFGFSSVLKSIDGGKSFQFSFGDIETDDIRRIELAVTPANPERVYALCANTENSGFQGIYTSMDAGDTWAPFAPTTRNLLGTLPDGSDEGGQGWYDLSLAVSPSNETEVYVGGINIWKTTGSVWGLVSFGYPEFGISNAPYVHVDQHILEYHPLNETLYSGNDGGIYYTDDDGDSWTDISAGLEILQIYRIGLSATRPDLFLMGSQDNSTIRGRRDDFKVVLGADGMECIVDYSDTNILYASSQRGNIRRSKNGGSFFESIKPLPTLTGAWVTPYILDPNDPKTIAVGYTDVYLSHNRGDSWTAIGANLSGGNQFKALAIAPGHSSYIYAATDKNIWRTENKGESWIPITTGLPISTSVITYIAVSQYDPLTIWVTLSNYTANRKVYTSHDGGNSWTNYSDGLPNVPVNTIVVEYNSNLGLYVGTDLGVYYRNKDMDTWEDFSSGLPNVIVNELEIFYPDKKLRAGTYGRGLWETDLYEPETPPLYAEFSRSRTEGCIEGTFKFINHSSDSDSLKWILEGAATITFPSSKDTALVTYDQIGDKQIGLIAFRDGNSDTLIRSDFVTVISSIDIQITSAAGAYYWRGDTTTLIATGGDNFSWSPSEGLLQTTGSRVEAAPESTTKYYVTANDGQCTDIDSLVINVYQNNLIQYALPLSIGENGPYFNYNATIETNEPHPPAGECVSQTEWCDEFGTGQDILANSIWFTFEGPPLEVASFETEGFDTQIAVYDAVNADSILAGHYTLLAANDDKSTEDFNAGIQRIDNLTPGKTYWLQVDGSAGNEQGVFSLYFYNTALGIEESPAPIGNTQFLIYPNPNDGSFNMQIQSNQIGEGVLTIYNLQGQMIQKQFIELIPGQLNETIEMPKSTMGIYLVKLVTPEWTEVKKVYIHK